MPNKYHNLAYCNSVECVSSMLLQLSGNMVGLNIKRTNNCPNCSWTLPRATPFKKKSNNPFDCPSCSSSLIYSSRFDKYLRIIVAIFAISYIAFMRMIKGDDVTYIEGILYALAIVVPLMIIFVSGLITMPWTDQLNLAVSRENE